MVGKRHVLCKILKPHGSQFSATAASFWLDVFHQWQRSRCPSHQLRVIVSHPTCNLSFDVSGSFLILYPKKRTTSYVQHMHSVWVVAWHPQPPCLNYPATASKRSAAPQSNGCGYCQPPHWQRINGRPWSPRQNPWVQRGPTESNQLSFQSLKSVWSPQLVGNCQASGGLREKKYLGNPVKRRRFQLFEWLVDSIYLHVRDVCLFVCLFTYSLMYICACVSMYLFMYLFHLVVCLFI